MVVTVEIAEAGFDSNVVYIVDTNGVGIAVKHRNNLNRFKENLRATAFLGSDYSVRKLMAMRAYDELKDANSIQQVIDRLDNAVGKTIRFDDSQTTLLRFTEPVL